MGWRVRKSYKILPGSRLNVGKRGMSISTKMGPVTLNSRGRATARVAKGVSYQVNVAGGSKSRRSSAAPQTKGCCLSRATAMVLIVVLVLVAIGLLA